MGINIHQLPAEIANQIAAGEVVERPASIVKELLENSCDAGADKLLIEIGYGGLNQIRLSDNGSGIAKEDLVLAVTAHATSKISQLEDLYALHSMGFRGEALASISSVAKCTIESRPPTADSAYCIKMHQSEWQVLPCARAIGTTIDVRDIFYNAPVRKKFLKNERSEFQAIEQVVKRFALAQPHIALRLLHNAQLVLDLPAAHKAHALGDRVAKLLGKPFYQSALPINEQRANMRLSGWLSGVDYQRSQQDKQWVYVNQRMVRDKLLNHAIKQAYESLLHPGRYPSCVLYLEVPPAEVDVNVHPTKHEVRFVAPRLVHDFIVVSLQKILSTTAAVAREQADSTNRSYQKSNAVAQRSPAFSAVEVREPLKTQSTGSEIKSYPINSEYSLIYHAQQAYLFHNERVNILLCEWCLRRAELPLLSRPLLVPLAVDIPKLKEKKHVLQSLQPYGFQLRILAKDQCCVASIPALLPQLALKKFLHLYLTSIPKDPEGICILLAQCIDYQGFIQPDYHALLEEFMASKQQDLLQQNFAAIRRLDPEICQRVFDA